MNRAIHGVIALSVIVVQAFTNPGETLCSWVGLAKEVGGGVSGNLLFVLCFSDTLDPQPHT